MQTIWLSFQSIAYLSINEATSLALAELTALIRLCHLVNDKDITQMESAMLIIISPFFDRHHIIYVEGIAVGSLLFKKQTKSALPSEAKEGLETHDSTYSDALAVDEDRLRLPNAASLLRKASSKKRCQMPISVLNNDL